MQLDIVTAALNNARDAGLYVILANRSGPGVNAMYPGVPFAGRDSVQAVDEILAGDEPREFLKEQLLAAVGSGALPDDFLTHLANNLDRGKGRVSFFRKLIVFAKARLPLALENFLRKNAVEGQQNIRRLALRALMVVRMHQMLIEDAAAGKKALSS